MVLGHLGFWVTRDRVSSEVCDYVPGWFLGVHESLIERVALGVHELLSKQAAGGWFLGRLGFWLSRDLGVCESLIERVALGVHELLSTQVAGGWFLGVYESLLERVVSGRLGLCFFSFGSWLCQEIFLVEQNVLLYPPLMIRTAGRIHGFVLGIDHIQDRVCKPF